MRVHYITHTWTALRVKPAMVGLCWSVSDVFISAQVPRASPLIV